MQQAPTQAVLQVLLSSTTDTHHQTRRGCAEYIAALLTSSQTGASAGPSASERQVNATLGAVQKMISDADPKVREAAAKCFWAAHERCPGKDKCSCGAVPCPMENYELCQHCPQPVPKLGKCRARAYVWRPGSGQSSLSRSWARQSSHMRSPGHETVVFAFICTT